MMSRRWGMLSVLSFLVTALAGCDGPGVVAPGSGPVIARTGVITISTAVVGTWRRTIFFIDEFRVSRSTETTWQFNADGTAVRTTVTRNFTFGLADEQLATGTWSVQGSEIAINVTSPSPFQLQLPFQVTADQLILSGETYFRATS